MAEVKRADIAELRELGVLQEANRQFFHPLGLALEVVVDEDGSERLGGIWDYRDDPEGIYYAMPLDAGKAARVADLRAQHFNHRLVLFSDTSRESAGPSGLLAAEPADVQPIDWQPSED